MSRRTVVCDFIFTRTDFRTFFAIEFVFIASATGELLSCYTSRQRVCLKQLIKKKNSTPALIVTYMTWFVYRFFTRIYNLLLLNICLRLKIVLFCSLLRFVVLEVYKVYCCVFSLYFALASFCKYMFYCKSSPAV